MKNQVQVPVGYMSLKGELEVPSGAKGIVLFAHGSGSSRFSPRNQHVASLLQQAGLGTLLFDLLTEDEEERDRLYGGYRFNIELMAHRLAAVTDWVVEQPAANGLPVGYFGASTGAAAAINAAADRKQVVRAVVSRGGRPDLAGEALERASAPTLLIVGGADQPVIRMNEDALQVIRAPKQLAIVPGAGHLFEEPGALDAVARLARDWFLEYCSVDEGDHKAARWSGAAV
jgi:pimeloyl-ACP methyl ester carboxylesterase